MYCHEQRSPTHLRYAIVSDIHRALEDHIPIKSGAQQINDSSLMPLMVDVQREDLPHVLRDNDSRQEFLGNGD